MAVRACRAGTLTISLYYTIIIITVFSLRCAAVLATRHFCSPRVKMYLLSQASSLSRPFASLYLLTGGPQKNHIFRIRARTLFLSLPHSALCVSHDCDMIWAINLNCLSSNESCCSRRSLARTNKRTELLLQNWKPPRIDWYHFPIITWISLSWPRLNPPAR